MQPLRTLNNPDKHDIKAAICRRFGSLQAMAERLDIDPCLIRAALRGPCRSGEEAIAKGLGQSLHSLWPDRWDADGQRLYPRWQKAYTNRPSPAPLNPPLAANGY